MFKIKKLIATLLVVCMMASVGSTVFAGEGDREGTWFTEINGETGVTTELFVPTQEQTSIEPVIVGEESQATPFNYDKNTWIKVTNKSYAPYNAIVKLKITYRNGDVLDGTGFVVGNGRIATSAHNLYKNRIGVWMSKIDVTFPATNTTVTTTQGTIPTGWMAVSGNEQEVALDYAILRVNSSYTNSVTKLGLSATSLYLNNTYTITGYPKASSDNYYGYDMYTHSGIASKWWYAGGVEHKINIANGVSGAPMYNSSNYVVGIQNYGYSENDPANVGGYATCITQPIIDFLLNI